MESSCREVRKGNFSVVNFSFDCMRQEDQLHMSVQEAGVLFVIVVVITVPLYKGRNIKN